MARRGKPAVLAMVLSGLLTTTWIIDDYLPATSENWSQRSAFRYIFEHGEFDDDGKKDDDRILSWWFYYRGETYFAKRRIWVAMEPNRDALAEMVDKHRGKGVTFWVMTTAKHAERAPSHFPADLRKHMKVVYTNFHYAVVQVDIP
jgi:hypothetical protein